MRSRHAYIPTQIASQDSWPLASHALHAPRSKGHVREITQYQSTACFLDFLTAKQSRVVNLKYITI